MLASPTDSGRIGKDNKASDCEIFKALETGFHAGEVLLECCLNHPQSLSPMGLMWWAGFYVTTVGGWIIVHFPNPVKLLLGSMLRH